MRDEEATAVANSRRRGKARRTKQSEKDKVKWRDCHKSESEWKRQKTPWRTTERETMGNKGAKSSVGQSDG